ncbi:polysaccharide deacetylase family protein [Pseudochryseolinea flava]|uniref:Polysaccharide deacetylase family protein n=1 Tax=Pseudochryseolinea flava TaxID=2059302 RepID=A0A364Y468_9BACT|nr:polysaccharide deacetylase family protein [Pseudochryseolinea flava]RAW01613.1 polysaccharide deacetylase family protein [Pseudochryseolinea flava]
MIHRTPFFLPWLYPSLVWRMPTREKVLYLTFDDGPVPGPTEFALHTLGIFKAKATFFCIGDNVGKYPQVFQKIVDDGHAIGNHTFNHLNGWKTSAEKYLDNVQQCDTIMDSQPVLSKNRRLFRPPYGRITRKQIKGLPSCSIIMWDVLSMDYNKYLSPESCLRNTINACRSGSIVVFHDSYKAERNMTYVLPRMLDHFASMGYAFKSIQP